MKNIFKLFVIKFFFVFNFLFPNFTLADNHNIYDTLEIIKNDLKTLERAVYSGSIDIESSINNKSTLDLDSNAEDVLTRHLLKLSEVEDQFKELTNKFEEINFKLDKLSNRLSKIQADNQVRFQDIENYMTSSNFSESSDKLTAKPKVEENKILPGSSQPQSLGSISYKDSEPSESSQQIQSVDTTASVLSLIILNLGFNQAQVLSLNCQIPMSSVPSLLRPFAYFFPLLSQKIIFRACVMSSSLKYSATRGLYSITLFTIAASALHSMYSGIVLTLITKGIIHAAIVCIMQQVFY